MRLKEICLIVIATAMLCIFAQPALATSAMSVEPAYMAVWQDEEFTVNITVDPAENEVYSASYTLHFDNTILNATLQTQGPFLRQDGQGSAVPWDVIDNLNGTVEYSEYRQGTTVGVSNPGVLATITFRVIGDEGISALNISDYNGELLYSTTGSILTDIYNGSVGVAQVQTPFLISGYVFYDGGSDCNDPAANITNLNISKEWTAETNVTSNYYQTMLSSCADVVAGEILCFNVTGPDGSSNITEHTVTQAEVSAGGIFDFNITLASSDATPPASVTDLQNTTYEQTCINWIWTDPGDADFAKVMVYIDGTPQPDVPKGFQCYNATGLTPDTEHEIATRTVDNLGNINDTWENHTAWTKPCVAPGLCLGTCYEGTACGGTIIAENMNCSTCLAEAGRVWAPNKDTACFNDTPFDLCLDWCPECCDCLDNDDDTDIDYPADEQCTCGLDPDETTPLDPIPELATFALIGVGLMLVVGLMRFGRKKR